ncbi:hypothetical protein Tco_0126415 [Tanacetum coccineum]
MSQPADQTQTPADSAVRNTVGKRSKQAPDSNPGYLPSDKLQKICEKHYNQILQIMAKKVHQEKLQGVQTRLDFGESLRQHSRTRGETVFSESESCDRQRKTRKKRRSSPASAPGDTYYSQNTSPKTPTKEKRKQEISSKAMSRVPVNVKEKSKENEMKQIGQTAGDQSVLRKPLSWKTRITKADTGNPNQRNKGRRMKKNCHNPGSVKKPIHSRYGSVTLKSLKELKCQLMLRRMTEQSLEIHHIKQREGEPTEAFMERFKIESMHINGAPEYMRISGFMHGITNPDIIKRLNDDIPKTVDEMMSMMIAFLRGEVAVANQSRKKALPA